MPHLDCLIAAFKGYARGLYEGDSNERGHRDRSAHAVVDLFAGTRGWTSRRRCRARGVVGRGGVWPDRRSRRRCCRLLGRPLDCACLGFPALAFRSAANKIGATGSASSAREPGSHNSASRSHHPAGCRSSFATPVQDRLEGCLHSAASAGARMNFGDSYGDNDLKANSPVVRPLSQPQEQIKLL